MNTHNPLPAMKLLGERLAEEFAGLETQVTAFSSGSAMLDVRRDGRALVMAFSPANGFAVDHLHPDDGFTTGYRFVFPQFEPAARRLVELARIEFSQPPPTISLLVIQAQDIEKAREFYSLLGLNFFEEQHGTGPRHYACVLDGVIFEIYPCTGKHPTSSLRFGFRIAAVDSVLEMLRTHGTTVLSEAKDSPWGRRAVVEDPDGNRVELLSARPGGNSGMLVCPNGSQE